ncbi:MAG: PRC-barrel domain-containing protein [Clostridia bacterium]|nr:PRC-barrel domain-containing protein [Clostridia bacterium]MDE6356116.1 PRC-barrel domain-containing protein [Clostridia bacterium]
MEVTFIDLKQKDVINLIDGAHLGKVCNLSFSFPENKVLGFTVTGCRGFKFSKQEIFLPISSIVKIGRDAVLVKYGKEELPPPPKPPKPPKGCPPPNCCPTDFFPCPPCPPPNCPSDGNRRSYDEYE